MSMLKSIAGKSILITGAASGLGAATARLFVEQGAKVTLMDRDEAKGNAVADSMKGSAIFMKTDVASEESVKAAIAAAKSSFGPLSGAVNCAGIFDAVPLLGEGSQPMETFQKIININLIGTFNVTRLAAQAMSTNEVAADEDRGVIVNTSSIAAYDGTAASMTGYSASKGAINALTLPAARELAANKIRVMTVAPGVCDTPMVATADMPKEVMDAIKKSVPYPSRMGYPSEYAALVHHIFQNQYLNGEVIRMDGCIRI